MACPCCKYRKAGNKRLQRRYKVGDTTVMIYGIRCPACEKTYHVSVRESSGRILSARIMEQTGTDAGRGGSILAWLLPHRGQDPREFYFGKKSAGCAQNAYFRSNSCLYRRYDTMSG